MKSHAGLTLIELMVTLVMAVVLLAVGMPAFRGLESGNRANVQTNGLVTALNLARSEAIARGVPVAVCARASAATEDACGTHGDAWGNGWLVLTDAVPNPGDCDGCATCTEAGVVAETCDLVVRAFAAPRGRGRADNGAPPPPVQASAGFVRFNSRGEQTGAVFRARSSQEGGLAGSDRCVRVAMNGQIETFRDTYADLGSCP
jgi:prepilin-type N-terminal cleavage/methylation domain-containing protein